MRKFVAVHAGDSVDDGCTVTHSVQNSLTYRRVDGTLPKHHVLPNGDIVFRYEHLADSGEYQCQAITEKGTYVASFFGIILTLIIMTHKHHFIFILFTHDNQVSISKRATVDPSAKRHSNGVSLLGS